jgi:hypothetical protein
MIFAMTIYASHTSVILPGIRSLFEKMAHKCRTTIHSRTTQVDESLTPEYSLRQHTIPRRTRDAIQSRKEGPNGLIVGSAFTKITEILLTMVEHKAPKGENAALERFLKF